MHKKLKSYFKKSAAVFTAAALTLSAGSAVVFGAGSYQEEEKKAFSKAIENLPKSYENLVEEYKAISTGAQANFSVQLEDAGRSMLSLLTAADFSWLNKLELKTKVLFQGGVEGVDMNLVLNDTQICNLQSYLDFYEQLNHIKIPELFDGYVKADMDVHTYDEDGNPSPVYDEISTAQLEQYMEFIMNMGDYMPQVSIVDTLVNRYGNLIIDHISDTSSSEEVLTLEDITQECTVYEGRLNPEELYTLAEDILTTAKEDAELKEVLTAWEETIPNAQNLYQNFLNGIDDSLTDIRTSEYDPENNSYISSKIWVSEDDVIVGRQFSVTDSTGTDPVITWQMPQQDGKYEYLLDFASEDSRLSLTGSGNITDNTMTGTYYLYSDSQPLISIEMENHDLASAKEGYGNVTYTITPLPGIADEETYNILSNFSLIADFASQKNNSTISLSVTSAGAVLGTIKIDSIVGSDMVIPEITESDKVYDTAADEDGVAFAEALSFDKIFDNLRQAGVPEELVLQLEASLEASLSPSEDGYLYDDEYLYDDYEES
ncbi:MAG: hypothetical protein Q4D16_01960 [Eubacteriales bacterium]|nr:hypothetical protein [Eubacteriales bacterium]